MAPGGELMKAISLLQPWADTILFLDKRIENRKRTTRHRGPVVIHISKGWDVQGEQFIRGLLFKGEMLKGMDVRDANGFMDRARARRGGFAGIMEIKDCLDSPQGLGKWAFGPKCYILEDRVIRFRELIKWRGQLGLWNIPKEIQEAVNYEIRWCWNVKEGVV